MCQNAALSENRKCYLFIPVGQYCNFNMHKFEKILKREKKYIGTSLWCFRNALNFPIIKTFGCKINFNKNMFLKNGIFNFFLPFKSLIHLLTH